MRMCVALLLGLCVTSLGYANDFPTSARVESGRAMSGRTGMSLASIVRRVMEVPATHSSGVAITCPAWTEACCGKNGKYLDMSGSELRPCHSSPAFPSEADRQK